MRKPFLTAEWKSLLMLNYEIDPAVLASRVPAGTEIDFWQGRTFVSLVAFMFLDTRVMGVSIPFHRNFEEINLRFYVKRTVNGEVRRAVVFVKEIVPRIAIALSARIFYNENYVALPTRHAIDLQSDAKSVEYAWKFGRSWQRMHAAFSGDPQMPAADSQEAFIAEHYWGYTPQRNGSTLEYEVRHPSWNVWLPADCSAEVDVARLYGPEFEPFLRERHASALVADGSAVSVYPGVKI